MFPRKLRMMAGATLGLLAGTALVAWMLLKYGLRQAFFAEVPATPPAICGLWFIPMFTAAGLVLGILLEIPRRWLRYLLSGSVVGATASAFLAFSGRVLRPYWASQLGIVDSMALFAVAGGLAGLLLAGIAAMRGRRP
jgi:hypothetical protein